jgi:uncharacterized protein YbjT (DUF2867 family)
MRCVVFGATGYLGARLVPELLSAGHKVRVMARTPAKLDDVPWRGRVEVIQGDVTDVEQVRTALEGQQVLYYLVHSMLGANFVEVDARGASIVADAAAQAGLSRIVYVGGIIPVDQELSEHLASRAEVGRLLNESGVPTVELRAAVIIGAGSASFEIMRYLTERLPLMVTPKWLRTRVQPIAVRDVLYYLTNAAELPAEVSRAFDIGGPETFTYTEMSRRYAAIAGLHRRVAIPVPVLTPRLSSHWVNLITPLPRSLATSLMDSLENDVVCTEHDIAAHIPDPDDGLTHYEDAVEFALARVREGELRTRWSRLAADDCPAQPLPTDPDWAGGSLHEVVFERTGGGSSTRIARTCCGCVRRVRYPAGCGWSCRCTKMATAVRVIVNARCSSRMALPVKCFGRRPHRSVTRSSVVLPVTSARASAVPMFRREHNPRDNDSGERQGLRGAGPVGRVKDPVHVAVDKARLRQTTHAGPGTRPLFEFG